MSERDPLAAAVDRLCPDYCVQIQNAPQRVGTMLQLVKREHRDAVYDILADFPEIMTTELGDRLLLSRIDDHAGEIAPADMTDALRPLTDKPSYPGYEAWN